MKCTNCNAENANDALFCTECGTKFSSPVPEQVPASEDLSATLGRSGRYSNRGSR